MDESKDRTLWIGNVAEDANEELLYELFLQVKYVILSTITLAN
jgi:RNA recognition motif-containing protein